MKLLPYYTLTIFLSIWFNFESIYAVKSKLKSKHKIDYLHYMQRKSNPKKDDFPKFKSTSSDLKYSFGTDNVLHGWLAISSREFSNDYAFPPVRLNNGTTIVMDVDNQDFRLNFANCSMETYNPPRPVEDDRLFFFSFSSQCKMFYTVTPTDLNLLGVFDAKSIVDITTEEDATGEYLYECIKFTDKKAKEYKICLPDTDANDKSTTDTREKWFCLLSRCMGKERNAEMCLKTSESDVHIEKREITQPIVMVPLPSPTCNENWGYGKNGDDWQCTCKFGKQQSPIDLPSPQGAIDSQARPIFRYSEAVATNPITTVEGILLQGETLNIINAKGYLHILHNDLGRIVTPDGTIFQAQEISFHTPSNHKINGKQYDLEVTIIHNGITKGDIGRQATLSFLFEKVAGAKNMFFEDIELLNLPNPFTRVSPLNKGININKLLYEKNEDEIAPTPVMKQFSFYTYQGSTPFPPCVERTIVYVASKPLKIGSMALTLLKEALQKPDLKDKYGNFYNNNDPDVSSNRSTQPINGRPIFHYEGHCVDKVQKIKKSGHYEKVIDKATQYFYVNSKEPSGLPGAFVVSKKEAYGLNNQSE